MANTHDSMIQIPMDGREIELLKKAITEVCDKETSKFKIAEYTLLFDKLESYRKTHHDNHADEILKRYGLDKNSITGKGDI